MDKTGRRYDKLWRIPQRIKDTALTLPSVLLKKRLSRYPLFCIIPHINCNCLIAMVTDYNPIENENRIKCGNVLLYELYEKFDVRQNDVKENDSSADEIPASDDSSEYCFDESNRSSGEFDSECSESTTTTEPLQLLFVSTYFTYGVIPLPNFTTCGEILCSVLNSTYNKLTVMGFEQNTEQCELKPVSLLYRTGNLCGKILACINLHDTFIIIINYKMCNNLSDCNLAVFKLKDDFTLRFLWSAKFTQLVDVASIRSDGEWLKDWCISPNRKKLMLLLSNGGVYVIDLILKSCILESAVSALSQKNESFSLNLLQHFSVLFHPMYEERMFITVLKSSLQLYDWSHSYVLLSSELPNNRIVTHMSVSTNQRRLSISCQCGDLLIYSLSAKNVQFLYVLNCHDVFEASGSTSAYSSYFTVTSQEICCCYSNQYIAIWKLPPIMDLKELCRLKLRTLYNKHDIGELNISNVFKRYLLFEPAIR